MKERESRFTISVVVPIYNVARYLHEAIESIARQTIGFEDNIQLILVDDGSSDESAEICKSYVEKFPNNVIFIRQKNAGVSAARNAGMKKATGEYITFFDADDMWATNAFERAVHFLDTNNSVDFAAFRLDFFDEIIDRHPLNFKFNTTRIIDIDAEPNNPLLHVITCVFRRSALKGYNFDTSLAISEDIKFIADVLANKRRYGAISDTPYYYRKRSDGSSAINGKADRKDYYIDTPQRAYGDIVQAWTHDGALHRYVQYLLLYDLSYRLNQSEQRVLTKRELRDYIDTIHTIIKKLDDEAIAGNTYLTIPQKLYMFRIKYGSKMDDEITVINDHVYFKAFQCGEINPSIHLDFIHVQDSNDEVSVEGYHELGALTEYSSIVAVSGHGDEYSLKWLPRRTREIRFFDDVIYDGGAFEGVITNMHLDSVSFVFRHNKEQTPLNITTGRFTGFGRIIGAYSVRGSRILTKSRKRLGIHRRTALRRTFYEARFLLAILVSWNVKRAVRQYKKLRARNLDQLSTKRKVFELLKPLLIIAETVFYIPKAIGLRIAYYLAKSFRKRPLWLFSDRVMAAGDNGEALFRYAMSLKKTGVDSWFVISKHSKDYESIKTLGPTAAAESLGYQLKVLLADKLLSSHADIETTNPFLRQIDHYVDLMNFDFVFLQHGIIRNDLSLWLNRFEKNIKLFVTSSQVEYNSILNLPYYYSKSEVVLSGMPRHDKLRSNSDNLLVIAPTYRKWLLGDNTNSQGERPYDPQFKTSEYYKFYQSLLNDKTLLAALKRAGMHAVFCVHPNFAQQQRDFSGSDLVKIEPYPYNYSDILSKGSLIVTDYSSVIMDFAYMRKPVVYAQFDTNRFYTQHTASKADFFDDEKDGFGPVARSYEELIKDVVATIEQGNKMSTNYKQRADSFFYGNDAKNSERVYMAVEKLGIRRG